MKKGKHSLFNAWVDKAMTADGPPWTPEFWAESDAAFASLPWRVCAVCQRRLKSTQVRKSGKGNERVMVCRACDLRGATELYFLVTTLLNKQCEIQTRADAESFDSARAVRALDEARKAVEKAIMDIGKVPLLRRKAKVRT